MVLKKKFLFYLALVMLLLVNTFNVSAEEITTVTTFDELESAIKGQDCDVIEIGDDIVMESTITLNQDIVIRSAAGEKFTLTATDSNAMASQPHFNFGKKDLKVTVNDLVLDGQGEGGGIFCRNSWPSQLMVENVDFLNGYRGGVVPLTPDIPAGFISVGY